MDQGIDTGIFTISLDFELHWGVSEHRTIESYQENLKNTPEVVEQLLSLFEDRAIQATWAVVGMLFCKNKAALSAPISEKDRPAYKNQRLSNYRFLDEIGKDEQEDPYHFALSLIRKIAQTKGQEIATHTFSHYYCLESGQTIDNFKKDIAAALLLADTNQCDIKSIIFPRNQYDQTHLSALTEMGIHYFRGNEQHWMYRPRSREAETWTRKLARLLDCYIKISGDNTHQIDSSTYPINIPSSRFLRPYDAKLAFLDYLRLKRICSEMTYAAKNKRLYHLWWHPHNFGKHLDANFDFLQKILNHYSVLHEQFGFQSKNMQEVGQLKPKYVS